MERTFAGSLLGLVDALDDANSHSLPHVTDGETAKGWVLVVGLDTHGFGRDEFDNASISGLDELGAGLHDLTRSAIDLLDELGELAGNVGGMTIENGGVSSTNLAGVVEDDDLGVEACGLLGGVVLGV